MTTPLHNHPPNVRTTACPACVAPPEYPPYVIGKDHRSRHERAQRGWSDRDAWSFDTYLAGVIAGGVRQLAERNCGHPAELTEQEWPAILTEIASGFEKYVEGAFKDSARTPEFERAFDLFRQWFGHLWD